MMKLQVLPRLLWCLAAMTAGGAVASFAEAATGNPAKAVAGPGKAGTTEGKAPAAVSKAADKPVPQPASPVKPESAGQVKGVPPTKEGAKAAEAKPVAPDKETAKRNESKPVPPKVDSVRKPVAGEEPAGGKEPGASGTPAAPGKGAKAEEAGQEAAADGAVPAGGEGEAGQGAGMDSGDDEAAKEDQEAEDESPKVARPVNGDPVQVFGWREWVLVGEKSDKMVAKLDTGALTSSIHAEEEELFERDGKKWVRFVVTDPRHKEAKRIRISAPLVRTTRIKNPGGESETRKVVRLDFQIGERKLRAEFTLCNRANMICPVLIGRGAIKELGMVDPGRTYLAEQKIFR